MSACAPQASPKSVYVWVFQNLSRGKKKTIKKPSQTNTSVLFPLPHISEGIHNNLVRPNCWHTLKGSSKVCYSFLEAEQLHYKSYFRRQCWSEPQKLTRTPRAQGNAQLLLKGGKLEAAWRSGSCTGKWHFPHIPRGKTETAGVYKQSVLLPFLFAHTSC